MLTTRRKLQIARVAHQGIRFGRSLAGLSSTTQVTRTGIAWELDLAEGIDLAIYLNSYQRLGRYLTSQILRPGSSAIDIGANVGAFALPLAKALGEKGGVLAIEATDFAFGKLVRNLALNPSLQTRIAVRQAVLQASDDAPTVEAIYASWRLDDAVARERHPAHGGIRTATSNAKSLTLDSLIERDPQLISLARDVSLVKLDVDGNELAVLRGARRFLGQRRPPILIEIAPYVQNEKPGGLAELLAEIDGLGYRMENPENGSPIATEVAALTRLIPDGAGMDVLCRAMDGA